MHSCATCRSSASSSALSFILAALAASMVRPCNAAAEEVGGEGAERHASSRIAHHCYCHCHPPSCFRTKMHCYCRHRCIGMYAFEPFWTDVVPRTDVLMCM